MIYHTIDCYIITVPFTFVTESPSPKNPGIIERSIVLPSESLLLVDLDSWSRIVIGPLRWDRCVRNRHPET